MDPGSINRGAAGCCSGAKMVHRWSPYFRGEIFKAVPPHAALRDTERPARAGQQTPSTPDSRLGALRWHQRIHGLQLHTVRPWRPQSPGALAQHCPRQSRCSPATRGRACAARVAVCGLRLGSEDGPPRRKRRQWAGGSRRGLEPTRRNGRTPAPGGCRT